MAAATKGMKMMVGSGADGSTYAHGHRPSTLKRW